MAQRESAQPVYVFDRDGVRGRAVVSCARTGQIFRPRISVRYLSRYWSWQVRHDAFAAAVSPAVAAFAPSFEIETQFV